MPEVTYKTVMNLDVHKIWDFVQDMNNWAPMLTGYQSHEIDTDTHSVWTLKGDVGVLSRKVLLDVNITEWNGPERVEFTLTGLNEQVEGDGTFEMAPVDASGEVESVGDAEPVPAEEPKKEGLFRRFLNWFFRSMFKRKFGSVERRELTIEEIGPTASSLSFRIRMDAGGPMAPMVNAMLKPVLMPAAEDLGNKIAAHLEELHGVEVARPKEDGADDDVAA